VILGLIFIIDEFRIFSLPMSDLVHMWGNIKFVILRNMFHFERVNRSGLEVCLKISQTHLIRLSPVFMCLFNPCLGLSPIRSLSVALIVFPPSLRLIFIIELRKFLSMNTNSDSSVLLGEIVNVGLLPSGINMTLDLACHTLTLVGLSKECPFAFFETCLGIWHVAYFSLILIKLLKHVLLAALLKQPLGSNTWAVDVAEAWCLIMSLFHISSVHRKALSHSGYFDLIVNLLVDRSVFRVIDVELRPDVLRSLN